MMRIKNTILPLFLTFAAAAAAASAQGKRSGMKADAKAAGSAAPRRSVLRNFLHTRDASSNATISFDTSGNGMLNGRYYVRLLSVSVQASGTMAGANSASGIMIFDGNGHYTFTGQNYASSSGQTSALTYSGIYSVASSGMAQIENPLYPKDANEQIYGGVSGSRICVGSSTEGTHNDVFIAIPVPSGAPANSLFQGTYWLGALEFPQATTAKVRNSMFQLTPNGQGSLGTVTVTGRDATQQNNALLTQTSAGAAYSFNSDGSGVLNIPAPSGVSAGSALFSGNKTFYISADGNYILGGSANTFDIFFGFKALSGPATNSVFQGVYYAAGIDADVTDPTAPYLFSFYASANATGSGASVWHERDAPIDQPTYDYTFDSDTQIASNGTVTHDYYKYAFGVNGDAFLITGLQTDYSLLVGVRTQNFSGSGVFLNPVGIWNAASFSPVTNSVATGEILTMYGQNLANSSASASALPLSPSLAGVQVMINGVAAPIVDVSPTRIDAIVPYSTSGGLVQIQVNNNGMQSNPVTLYQGDCSPGVFTLSSNGLGYGAILHSDYSVVNSSKPARQGEVVQIFLTGLGDVSPPVADGAPAPSNPLTGTTNSYEVWIGGAFSGVQGTVQFQGLAPGFPGLYQINVQIPTNAPLGDQYIGINTTNCYNEQAKIPIVAR
jgi:uncharacterized protein (TIGR03437 family)